MTHEDAVERLFDRELGRLDEPATAELEAHVAECDRCRRMTTVYSALRAALDDEREHLAPDEIATYVTDRDGLLPPERERVQGHLDGCASCSQEYSRASRVEAKATQEQTTRVEPAGSGRAPWHRSRTMWALAAGILLAALVYPAYLGTFRLPGVTRTNRDLREETLKLKSTIGELDASSREASAELDRLRTWTGTIGIHSLRSTRRGEASDQKIVLDASQPFGILGIQVFIPRDAKDTETLRFRFAPAEERGAPEPIDVPVEKARRQMKETGVVTLILPTTSLEPGPYRLRVTTSAQPDRDPLLDVGFEVSFRGR